MRESVMRRMHRIMLLAGLVALAPALTGCENFDMDKLDVFGLSDKKKLPGDRKPLFPQGVPGVSQGIPPEYIKGNQPPPDTAQTPPAEPDKAAAVDPAKQTAAVEPEAEPKPKAKPKPKPKPRAAAAQSQQAPQQQPPQQAVAPWPGQNQSPASTGTAPWPTAPASGNAPR